MDGRSISMVIETPLLPDGQATSRPFPFLIRGSHWTMFRLLRNGPFCVSLRFEFQ